MAIRTSLDSYRATIWSALALSPLVACGGVTSDGTAAVRSDSGAGGTGNGGTGAVGAGAMLPAAGGAPATGGMPTGGISSGGFPMSGAPGAGGAIQTTCLNQQPFVGPNGAPTGLVSCDGGYAFHRVARVDCPSIVPRPPTAGGCMGATPGSGFCCQDSDCTAQPYGHCEFSARGGPGGAPRLCSYGCVRDSECATGEICLCGPAVGQCIPAGCTTDADCHGFLCITSDSTPNPNDFCDTQSIACQTPTDRCTTGKDCGTSYSFPCVVMPGGQRACRDTGCGQGGWGRPFIVDGFVRLAPARERDGWSTAAMPCVQGLGAAHRSALAARWTEIALAEHASIAANARFVLELLSLGAPAGLVRDAHEAMGDEAQHARDAFALASAYAGRPVGPGPLDISGVLGRSSPHDIVRTAITEGCIGETVAAVEAAEALAFAGDESVRAALSRAASDEIRHTELAWKFIRWMLEVADSRLRIHLASCFRESIRSELRRVKPVRVTPDPRDQVLLAHGFLDPATRLEIRARVIAEIVEPCARGLLAGVRARAA